MGALLCKAQATISAEREYAAGIVSTNLPPEQGATGELSPERTAQTVHPLLEPAAPPPVANGVVAMVTDDGDVVLEDAPPDPKRKLDWDDSIESYQSLMAMASVSNAKGKGKGQNENGSKKSIGEETDA